MSQQINPQPSFEKARLFSPDISPKMPIKRPIRTSGLPELPELPQLPRLPPLPTYCDGNPYTCHLNHCPVTSERETTKSRFENDKLFSSYVDGLRRAQYTSLEQAPPKFTDPFAACKRKRSPSTEGSGSGGRRPSAKRVDHRDEVEVPREELERSNSTVAEWLLGLKESMGRWGGQQMVAPFTPDPSVIPEEGVTIEAEKQLEIPARISWIWSSIQAYPEDFQYFSLFLKEKKIPSICDQVGFAVVKLDLDWLVQKAPEVKTFNELIVKAPRGSKECVKLSYQTVDKPVNGICKIENLRHAKNKKGLVDLDTFLRLSKSGNREYKGTLEEMVQALCEDIAKEKKKQHVYGQDSEAKLVLPKLKVPQVSLSHLDGNELQNLKGNVEGISTDYAYLGVGGSMFAAHIEDWNLHSFNVHVWGDPKIWYFVEPSSRGKLEEAVKEELKIEGSTCSQFVRHQSVFLSDEFLNRHGIKYRRYCQQPGDLLIISPWSYHQGFNTGLNLAVANNYAFANMKEEGYYTGDEKYTNCEIGVCPLSCAPMSLEFK